jgi:N-acetyl-anhydromuramyl-L-alanine amidase AmpD
VEPSTCLKIIDRSVRNETFGSAVSRGSRKQAKCCGVDWVEPWESDMMSEMQIHTIARQMMEKHGLTAIAQAAHNALACESKGDAEEAREWRHIEDAMKLMRGPHQS